ncbi:MAG: dephospho-CoA kinase [Alphaproteobacteria bacterium]
MNKKPFVVGLTGPLASGKSTVASIFAALGAAVWNADAAIHALQAAGAPCTKAIAEKWGKDVLADDGSIDRAAMSRKLLTDPKVLPELEKILFPAVKQAATFWLQGAQAPVAILEAPLLLEADMKSLCNVVACCMAAPEIQQVRALERNGMTLEKYRALRARQRPNVTYTEQCDVVINTDDMSVTEQQVTQLYQGWLVARKVAE